MDKNNNSNNNGQEPGWLETGTNLHVHTRYAEKPEEAHMDSGVGTCQQILTHVHPDR